MSYPYKERLITLTFTNQTARHGMGEKFWSHLLLLTSAFFSISEHAYFVPPKWIGSVGYMLGSRVGMLTGVVFSQGPGVLAVHLHVVWCLTMCLRCSSAHQHCCYNCFFAVVTGNGR